MGAGSIRDLDRLRLATDYDFVIDVLKSGDRARLEELALLVEGFPDGVDSFIGRRWIINAIGVGAMSAIQWMLSTGVDLSFRDEEGYTPLLSAIEHRSDDRYEVLRLLLDAGAPVNRKGINDWTPAHMAAARDDVEALRLLVAHGADLTIRTEIDEYATPLEEARHLRRYRAVAFLESVA